MTIEGFIAGVVIGLFGYNYVITKWQKYQERKRIARLGQRDIRNH